MEIDWRGDKPFMEFDGSNGQAIAEAMSSYRETREIFVNPNHSGAALSLSQRYVQHEGQPETHDRWRVPVGYSINIRDGEVIDSAGRVQDYEELTKL